MSVRVRPDRLVLVATALVLCSVAGPVRRADAQEQQPQQQQQQPVQPEQPRTQSGLSDSPFRNVFANRPPRPDGQSATFTLAGYGGYDDNVITDSFGVGSGDPRAQGGGSKLVGADTGLQYTKTIARRMSFAANGAGTYRYYPDRSSLSTWGINGGVGLSLQVGRRTRVRLDQSVAYQPYYQLGLLPGFGGEADLGASIPTNLDFAVLKRQTVIYSSDAMVEQQLSRRSTLTVNGQYFRQTLDEPPPGVDDPTSGQVGDVTGYTAGIHFKRQLTRYLSLRLGDEYRRFIYPTPTRRVLEGNNIDVGVDYARSLAFSRHTSLSFTSGTSIVSFDGRQFADITGAVSLTHLFSRNWQGQVAYQRNLNFVETLNRPLFGDSANVSLQGIIRRKLLMSISGGYLSGRLGLNADPNDNSTLRTGTGTFNLTYAFNTYLRATFDYSYFSYHFSNDTILPTGLRPTFDRNSLRGGLSLVMPLIR